VNYGPKKFDNVGPRSFGMAFLTLFRIATGDNWNGIMKDTLREECEDGDDCLRNCCVSPYFAPLFFVVFVLMAQFVLVNVVVAVLMKHLEESHKQVGGCTPTPRRGPEQGILKGEVSLYHWPPV
jgi:hypothetical protein